MRITKDITGKRFGNLVALDLSHKKNSDYYWITQCDCGNFKTVRVNRLNSGSVTHCGCNKKGDKFQLPNLIKLGIFDKIKLLIAKYFIF